jgi:hypothetical protein
MKWLGLMFTNMLRTHAVGRALEPSREIFGGADVIARASLRVITTLEFLQHEFA